MRRALSLLVLKVGPHVQSSALLVEVEEVEGRDVTSITYITSIASRSTFF
jgi:hypothetical protein